MSRGESRRICVITKKKVTLTDSPKRKRQESKYENYEQLSHPEGKKTGRKDEYHIQKPKRARVKFFPSHR